METDGQYASLPIASENSSLPEDKVYGYYFGRIGVNLPFSVDTHGFELFRKSELVLSARRPQRQLTRQLPACFDV